MKKFILFIVWLLSLGCFSFWADLSIFPSEWSLWKNCVEKFDISLNMWPDDKAIAMDLVMESNMEYIDFEKSDMFLYAVPPHFDWNKVMIALFNDFNGEFSGWWLIWTFSYKIVSNDDPYLKFYFNGVWETDDVNVVLDWKDILSSVINWSYTISADKVCEDVVLYSPVISNSGQNIDEFIEWFTSDHKAENRRLFFNKYWIYMYCWIAVFGVFLIILIVLISRRWVKKWKTKRS